MLVSVTIILYSFSFTLIPGSFSDQVIIIPGTDTAFRQPENITDKIKVSKEHLHFLFYGGGNLNSNDNLNSLDLSHCHTDKLPFTKAVISREPDLLELNNNRLQFVPLTHYKKSHMIRNLIFLIIIFVSTNITKAQNSTGQNISISVSARVTADQPVELTTLQNMIIQSSDDEYNYVYISPMTDVNAGLMRTSGIPGLKVLITYQISDFVTGNEDYDKVIVNYVMSANHELVQEASTLIDSGETVLDFGDDGVYYLWLGGEFDLSRAFGGRYVGQFTIEIEYI